MPSTNENGRLMELRVFLRALRGSWVWILVFAIVGAAAAGLLGFREAPKYASSITFFATTPNSTPTNNSALTLDQFAQQRVNTYVLLADSDRLARLVLSTSKIDRTVKDIQDEITASSQQNTVLLTVTATDTSLVRAIQITQALQTNFPELVASIESAGGSKQARVDLAVVDGPTANPKPVSPRTRLYIALGLLLGLVMGVIFALMRELLTSSIRSTEVLRSMAEVPVLGVIDADSAVRRSPVTFGSGSRSPRSEMFRQIRTSLQFVNVDEPAVVIVITSQVKGEGKSSTAVNLAAAFAETGRSVLLVDGDLRRPAIAEMLGLEGAVGLSNLLANQAGLDDVIQPWGSGGLMVMTSGSLPPNPSELLGSRHMAELVETLRQKFEIVILDTPPVLPFTDAAVAATLSDGVVLIVRHGKTKRSMFSQAVDNLHSVDVRILGTILNFSPRKNSDSRSSYSGDYYEETSSRASRRRNRTSENVTGDQTG